MTEPELSTYFTTTEVAKRCGMSQATVLRAISTGVLRASTTPGGHFRVSLGDLLGFMRENNIAVRPQTRERTRVLIVEDNAVELRVFKRALRDADVEIKDTGSGVVAGYLLRDFRPDVILLDIFLKDIDGRSIVRLIRSDPELRRTRIVAISGTRDKKALMDIQASGIDKFLQKPVSTEALREAVFAWTR